MNYYILEVERLTYIDPKHEHYEILRYVYPNKKTAIEKMKLAKELDAIKNVKLVKATTKETLSCDI